MEKHRQFSSISSYPGDSWMIWSSISMMVRISGELVVGEWVSIFSDENEIFNVSME